MIEAGPEGEVDGKGACMRRRREHQPQRAREHGGARVRALQPRRARRSAPQQLRRPAVVRRLCSQRSSISIFPPTGEDGNIRFISSRNLIPG